MLILLACPECVPAEVMDRFSLASTDGPVDHVQLGCAVGHHFRMAAGKLLAPPASARGSDHDGRRVAGRSWRRGTAGSSTAEGRSVVW